MLAVDIADLETLFGAVALTLALGLLAVMVWGLLTAARRTPMAMVTVSLSILTLVALLGLLVNPDQPDLGVIVGTGFGALAGAVTSLFREGEEAEANGGGGKHRAPKGYTPPAREFDVSQEPEEAEAEEVWDYADEIVEGLLPDEPERP